MNVNQQTHELRHGKRRMGIVQMDGDFVGKLFYAGVVDEITMQKILQRGADVEIFLLES
jgi:hypothetical protein